MNYKLVHVGVNCESEKKAEETANLFSLIFNLNTKIGAKSIFAGTYFECMKAPFRGTNGHIAMTATNLAEAIEELSAKGFEIDPETLTLDENRNPKHVYLKGEIGGFAVHILQEKS